jgi:hypothetical protein
LARPTADNRNVFDHLDVDFTLPVGQSERHEVGFTWRQGWAEAVMTVDGAEVLRERHPWGMRTVRRYQVSVGTSERHTVTVEKRKPWAWGGVRKNSFRVFVDGQVAGEH